MERSSIVNLPPEIVKRLRKRRPGYNSIRKLVQAYGDLSNSAIANLKIDAFAKDFVVPMFLALGWQAEIMTDVTIDGDSRQSSSSRVTGVYVMLHYQTIDIYVGVQNQHALDRRLSDLLARSKGIGIWAMLTNFETVLVLDSRLGKTVLETSPIQYISDESEEHDVLAADIFFERIVKVESKIDEIHTETLPNEQTIRSSSNVIQDLGDKVNVDGVVIDKRQEPPGDRQSKTFVYDTFIAFNHTDIEFARRLDADLTKQGLRVWFDDRELTPGTEFEKAIFEGVEASRSVAIIVSPRSMGSEWVRRLLGHALDIYDGIFPVIIPVLLQDAEMPVELAGRMWVDFRDPNIYDQAIGILVGAIRGEHLEPKSEDISTQNTPPVTQPTQSDESPPTALGPTKTVIPTRALADTTSEDNDLLRFDDYAQALADFIKNEKTGKPLTIGIDAAWGMGKSTLMKMLRRKLANTPRPIEGDEQAEREMVRGENGLPTVWFNAWRYSKEESLWAALALEILAQMNKQFSRWQRLGFWLQLAWERFDWGLLLRRVLKSLAVIVAIGGLGALVYVAALAWVGYALGLSFPEALQKYIGAVGVIAVATTLYSVGKEAYDKIAGSFDLEIGQYIREPKYQERIGFLAEFDEDFRHIVEVVTENGKWPLVVFIDDLDRCAPPKPTDIVEAINLLLDAKHCVFVIGMDSRTVAGAIEAKYKDLKMYLDDTDDPGGLTLGQRFLEKIVQINFRIPKTDPTVVSSYIQRNLRAEKEEVSKPPAPEVKRVAEKIQAEQRRGRTIDEAAQAVQVKEPQLDQQVVVQAKQEVFAQSFDDSPDVQKAVEEAAQYLRYNPRKIKQFINLFRLRALIANRRGLLDSKSIVLSLLAKWVIIRTRWPDLIKAAETNPEFIGNLKQAWQLHARLTSGSGTSAKQQQQDKQRLDILMQDKRTERLIDASDLDGLLDQATQMEDYQTYVEFV